jgi:hypothetical protein
MRALVNRKRFIYTQGDVMGYLVRCACCRDVRRGRRQERMRKHFLFDKCLENMNLELDVVALLKQARQTRVLTQILLNQRQKMLLRFQRKHLVETSSSSQDSDLASKFDTIRLMDSTNPLVRLSIFGRLKKMVMSYKELGELGDTDRRLLRGLYLKKLKDFDEQI